MYLKCDSNSISKKVQFFTVVAFYCFFWHRHKAELLAFCGVHLCWSQMSPSQHLVEFIDFCLCMHKLQYKTAFDSEFIWWKYKAYETILSSNFPKFIQFTNITGNPTKRGNTKQQCVDGSRNLFSSCIVINVPGILTANHRKYALNRN